MAFIAAIAAIVVTLVAVLIGLNLDVSTLHGFSTPDALPVLAICTIAGLLAVLAVIAVVFRRMEIGDGKQAMGLPDGSSGPCSRSRLS